MSRQTKDAIKSVCSVEHLLDQLFIDLRQLGRPTHSLVDICVQLSFDNRLQEIIYPRILISLVHWLRDLHENEQLFLCDFLTSIVALNLSCKNVLANIKMIMAICDTLQHANALQPKCSASLIRLVEELGKYSISSSELKAIVHLLRIEQKFPFHKQLLQTLASIALHSLTSSSGNGALQCSDFLDIQAVDDGITVPDIRRWIGSGSYGFIFHAWIRLDRIGASSDLVGVGGSNGDKYRRVILNLMSAPNGTGYEVFIDRHGKLVVGILTKKEYLATTVSTTLSDKR